MMTDKEITDIAIKEIETKSWGVTEQFLEIHDVVRVDGVPKLERIDRDKPGEVTVVYIPVKDEKFYFAIYIQSGSPPEIIWVGTENYNDLYFQASSKDLGYEELAALTSLEPSGGWRKDAVKKFGTGTYKYSLIRFCPNPEPDEFEDKLKKLLDFLEQDPVGIKRLIDLAGGHIQVAIYFHNGNTMLGGPHIGKESIKRMAALNLEIDFDLYAKGNFYK
jgi:hypothetical protein